MSPSTSDRPRAGNPLPVAMLIFFFSLMMAAVIAIPVVFADILGGNGINTKRLDVAIVCGIMAAFFEFMRRRRNSENKMIHAGLEIMYGVVAVVSLATLALW